MPLGEPSLIAVLVTLRLIMAVRTIEPSAHRHAPLVGALATHAAGVWTVIGVHQMIRVDPVCRAFAYEDPAAKTGQLGEQLEIVLVHIRPLAPIVR